MASSTSGVQAALIDLNGTLHIDLTPGAVEALNRLRAADVSVRFVTKTTKQTVSSLLELFQGMGFDIEREEVSSLTATHKLLEDRGLRSFLLMHPEVLPDFEGIPTHDQTVSW